MGLIKWAERKMEMQFAQKIIAEAIERVFKNKVTSIIGLIVIVGGAITGASHVISPDLMFHGIHIKAALVTIGELIAGVALLLAKDAGVKLPAANMLLAAIVLGLVLAPSARAQAAPTPDPLQNIYAAGVSYSVNASPAIAGTALYAHLIADSGTYTFTAIDAVPNTIKPFTVTSNIGAGIAQKIATLGKVPIYVPTAVGVSWSGTNTGWQWNSGALAAVHIKGQYYLMPAVRFLKSSVSGGTGYQPMFTVLFGWGN